jgi:hypothetical protein
MRLLDGDIRVQKALEQGQWDMFLSQSIFDTTPDKPAEVRV